MYLRTPRPERGASSQFRHMPIRSDYPVTIRRFKLGRIACFQLHYSRVVLHENSAISTPALKGRYSSF